MVSTGFRLALVSLVLLGTASVGTAQVSEVKGTVQRVDASTGMVYFTDGRTSGPNVAPGTVVVQSVTPATVAPSTSVDATGIVASVDTRTGTVTLQDGRVVRVTPGTTVWQPVTIGSVMPGASVFVRNAEALDFRPATPSAVSQPYQMGTIGTVTPATSRVVLSDGTVVQSGSTSSGGRSHPRGMACETESRY
jgi:hypothetical protein